MSGFVRVSVLALSIGAAPALAAPPANSPIPSPRPEQIASAAPPAVEITPRRGVEIEVIAVTAIEEAEETSADGASVTGLVTSGTDAEEGPSALAVEASRRPTMRGEVPAEFAARAEELRDAAEAAGRATETSDPEFRAWIAAFQARALAAGITRATFDQAFEGVQLNTRVLERDRNQAEFSRALWDYLDSAVSATRVENGRAQLAEYRTTLARIEEQYRVEAEVVAAIWGLESAYGAMRGSTDIIEAMASLAYDGRRQDFFEAQLIAALQILQAGDTRPRNMTGSWAGAMGHTQFMPTSYLEFAQDFTGDGRRDIWSDNPIDALASTAHYLAEHGWTYGQPWGMEVTLPDGFDYALAGEQERIGVAFWNGQGVRLVNGDPIPDHGRASILLPAGHSGVALVVFNNFRVIERYNPADAYVIAVGHLSDRITGGPAFEAGWPRGDRALSFDERQEMQRHLQSAGHYSGRIDGLVGPITIAAVRSYQTAIGVTPDGYASLSILERLRNS